jgi:RibD C-terminal domain
VPVLARRARSYRIAVDPVPELVRTGRAPVSGASLLENDLVDEINLLVCPVVVGEGTRLFPDNGPDLALDLVESPSFPKGITIQVYRPRPRPAQVPGDGFDGSDRSRPAYQKVLKEIRGADVGSGQGCS